MITNKSSPTQGGVQPTGPSFVYKYCHPVATVAAIPLDSDVILTWFLTFKRIILRLGFFTLIQSHHESPLSDNSRVAAKQHF